MSYKSWIISTSACIRASVWIFFYDLTTTSLQVIVATTPIKWPNFSGCWMFALDHPDKSTHTGSESWIPLPSGYDMLWLTVRHGKIHHFLIGTPSLNGPWLKTMAMLIITRLGIDDMLWSCEALESTIISHGMSRPNRPLTVSPNSHRGAMLKCPHWTSPNH